MKYRYKKHPGKMATIMVTYGAGARAGFKKYQDGIAHVIEHMCFKGTDKYTAKDILWKIALSGGSMNAWTNEDLVSYHITIPEDSLEVAFECLSQIVNKPTFPQEEYVKEQEVICQEVRMYDDMIGALVGYKLAENIFDNPLAIPVIGYEKSVRATTRQDLVNFYNEFYNNDKKLISLCSSNDRSDLVEKYFGQADDKLSWTGPYALNYKPSYSGDVKKEGQLQNIISIAFAGDALDKIENRANISMFNKVFGSGDVSRLFLKIREDLGLVYGISSCPNKCMDGQYFSIETETEPENSEKVIKEIDNQIEIMQTQLASEEEMESARSRIKSGIYSREESSSSSIASILNKEFYNGKTQEEMLRDVQATTPEDVREVARKIFSTNKYIIIGHG